MELKIAGKTHELKFGMGFLRTLDKAHSIEQYGITFGVGLQTVLPNFLAGSPVALSEIISAATGCPQAAVDDAIEAYAEENDLDELFDSVKENLETASLTKKITGTMLDSLEEVSKK